MSLYEHVLRPLAFRFDPEWVHERAMKCIERGLFAPCADVFVHDPIELFGVRFPNRIGLAAGFDKHALAVAQWHRYGFGFVEIGTVTRHAQPGNKRPRLFRYPSEKALINRMGFNNEGAEAIAARLERTQPKIPLGINLGKSKVTELDEAHTDYAFSYRTLLPFGDYFVVNVSSPNTPGLRTLQDREPLLRIFDAIQAIDSRKPLFVKIAPDLSDEALAEVVSVAVDRKLTGIVATNTTLRRDMLKHDPNEAGGLSGVPVRDLSNATLRKLKALVPSEMTLIGAGGVFTKDDVREKRALGAELVQLYTGWIYGAQASFRIC